MTNPTQLPIKPRFLASILERLLGLHRLGKIYDRRPLKTIPRNFLDYTLGALGVSNVIEHEENLDEIAPALAAIPAVLGKVAVVGAKGAAIAGKAAAKGAVVAGKAAGKAAVKGGKVAVKGTKKAATKIGDAAVQKAKDVVIQKAQDVAVDAIAKRKERHSQETVAASYKPESSVIRSVSYTDLRAHETPEHRGWRGVG